MADKETIEVVVDMITLIGLLIMLYVLKMQTVLLEVFQLTYNENEWFNIGLNVGADFTSDIRKQNFEIGSRTSSTVE